MKKDFLSRRKLSSTFTPLRQRRWLALSASVVLLVALASVTQLSAQKKAAPARSKKLPSAEKIVGDYLKATGGKKRHAGIKDATYEWTMQLKDQLMGVARNQTKSPASTRMDMTFGNGEINSAVSARSAWTRGLDGNLRTLTDADAGAAKLQSALDASRLVDYKKLNVLARTVAFDETLPEPTYVVEFSTKEGARLRYWFSTTSKLLLKTVDVARGTTTHFSDYRAENGALEPHRMEMTTNGKDAMTFLLKSVRYNAGLSDTLFDPPSVETPDIAKLLREVEENQKKIDERVSNYAFTEKRTEREINDQGEVKKEKVTVSEIYPLPGGGAISKLISENGEPLSAERAAKQDKKIAEDVAKYELERQKREQKKKEEAEKNKGQAAGKKDEDKDDVGVAVFLRACEFVSPRRERLRDREAVVFDFRPRPGFRPRNTAEDIVTKLAGVVWIDPVDKTVIRLEAKLAQSYKVAGGLVASIRPGSAFAFEQTRMAEGVWLPRSMQVNFAAKIFLFKGIEANETREFSDYRRFDAEASDYKIGAPATNTAAPPKP
ncbi:MAG: hypothetical protein QOH25_3083 [Acidobacteriota bacterium]|jgi:hypothetical protein|nr:hypothetical protein [Acidobacteriota bacterium]